MSFGRYSLAFESHQNSGNKGSKTLIQALGSVLFKSQVMLAGLQDDVTNTCPSFLEQHRKPANPSPPTLLCS